MGKKSKPKIEVTFYYMSIHFGICIAADKLKRIIVKEKEAWSGSASGITAIPIDKEDLFGGKKKEGGVEGTVTFLPGASDQILPDILATRLGRSSGLDAPGYRGICTAFFTGEGTEHGSGGGGSLSDIFEKLGSGGSTKPGFMWGANSPYLPPVWLEVERAPIGLNPAYAMIPREGFGGVPTFSQTIDLNAEIDGGATYAEGLAAGTTISGFLESDVLQITQPAGELYAGWSPWGDPSPVKTTIPKSGAVNKFSVVPDGDASAGYDLGSAAVFDGYEAARAAFGTAQVTGATSYTFFIKDTPLSDNSGGVSLLVEKVAPSGDLDANPAHIIYECLTNTDWGMGSPSTAIDVDSFNTAAITLYAEGFGLSMIWTRQAAIEKFVQEVLDHILAVLFVDPSTGLLTLKLIRDDYVVEDLPNINPSNATLSNFGRKIWGEIVNEIVVTWTNPENEQDETVTAQDLASIVTQGGIISDGRNYYGVRYGALAKRLAARDLRASGAPLAACDAEVDRTLWQMRPASTLTVTWPEHGLSELVMRVTNVNYGRPGDPKIKLSLIEDVFGLDAGDYVEPPSTGWEDPSTEPDAAEFHQIFTLPLFFAAATDITAFVDTPEYPEVLAGVLASSSNGDTLAIELWDEISLPDGSTEWQQLNSLSVIGRGELDDDVPAEAVSTITSLSNLTGRTGPIQGGFIIIGDGTEAECEIALITDVGEDVTVDRGVLDTVPRAWPAGTPVWFIDLDTSLEDPELRSAGETVSYKLLPRTSLGLYPLASASLVTHDLIERPWLPNRPANVLAHGAAFSTAIAPVDATDRADPWVTVTWANRNRLLEETQVLSWTDATVDPETGQTTKIEVLSEDGLTVLATHDALAGTSFDVPEVSFGAEDIVEIRVSAERTDADGTFESLQAHSIWVQVGPVRATEGGDMRLTESGHRRKLED